MTEHWIDAASVGGDGSQGSPWSPTDLAGLTIVASDIYHMNGDFSSPVYLNTGDGTGTIFTNTTAGIPFRLNGFSGTVCKQVLLENAIFLGVSTYEVYSCKYCYTGMCNVYGNSIENCTLWGTSGYFNINPPAPHSVTVTKSILWALNYKGKGPLFGTGSQVILVKDCVSHLSGVINGGGVGITLDPGSDPLTIVPRPSGYPDPMDNVYTDFDLVSGYGVGAVGGWAAPYVPPTPTNNISSPKPSVPKKYKTELKIREINANMIKSSPVQSKQPTFDIRKIRKPF